MTAPVETVTVRDLKFLVRPDTSDLKAINEVVRRGSYGRHGFLPAANEHWVDLGANIGAFSVWAASKHPSIQIHAYEPDPDMCELIYDNAVLNGVADQIDIVQAAVVADDRPQVDLHCNVARGNVWRNSIERSWRGEQVISVPAVSIEEVIARAETVVDGAYWMKIDVEGTEMPIIEWMLVNETLPTGMIFEWSFDVDSSLQRFAQACKALKKHYKFIEGNKLQASLKGKTDWPAEYFPACRLVYVK